MAEQDGNRVREALLRAGEALCGQADGTTGQLTAANLAHAARISEAEFQTCFPSLEEFRRALLQHMMNVVRAEVLEKASVFKRPGFERLWGTVEAFLDVNLRHPAMRRLAHALRTDPTAVELLRQRTNGYTMVFRVELDAMGHPNPAGASRLATAMIVEAAKAESESGQAVLEVRRALHAFLKGYGS